MKVLIMFHIEDEDVRRIMSQDMQAEDLIDQINDAATEGDQRHEVWHFGDSSHDRVATMLNRLWDEESKKVPDLKLIGRL